jgi:hypothetical protein
VKKSFKGPQLYIWCAKPNLKIPIEKPIQHHFKQKKKARLKIKVVMSFSLAVLQAISQKTQSSFYGFYHLFLNLFD